MSSAVHHLLRHGRAFVQKSSSFPKRSVTSVSSNNRWQSVAVGNRLYSSSSPPPPLPGDSSREPFIPAYQQRHGESVDTLKARLLYQSRKRGMLENGLLLSTFAAKFLNSMDERELREYDRLINLPSNDWDLFYWATGVKPIPKEFDTAILHKFIEHVRNTDKESRLQQPDL